MDDTCSYYNVGVCALILDGRSSSNAVIGIRCVFCIFSSFQIYRKEEKETISNLFIFYFVISLFNCIGFSYAGTPNVGLSYVG